MTSICPVALRPPSILEAALLMAADSCPPERCMMLCRIESDDLDEPCMRCWRNYLIWIANNRRTDPYADQRKLIH